MILLLAAALVVLVVAGVAGVVALGAWEARMDASAPRRAPLLVLWDEQVVAHRARAAAATKTAPVAAGRAVVARPVRALRAALVHG